MLKVFNAFQMTVLFAAAPFGIQYLATATFPFQAAAFWLGIIAYMAFFVCMWVCVTTAIDK